MLDTPIGKYKLGVLYTRSNNETSQKTTNRLFITQADTMAFVLKRATTSAGALPARFFAASAGLDVSRMEIHRSTNLAAKTPKEELLFGKTFTDHSLEIDWTKEGGWGAPRITPRAALQIDPAASCLHYGYLPLTASARTCFRCG